MFALYVDDDLEAVALVNGLRPAGVDVLRATDAGMRGSSDEDDLQFAFRSGRVLYTANRGDFAHLHGVWLNAGRRHAGIIILTNQRISIGDQLRQLLAHGVRYSADEMVDRLEWLQRPRIANA